MKRIANSIRIDGTVFIYDDRTKRIVWGLYNLPDWFVVAYCMVMDALTGET